jgi:hypothetical protein
MRSCNWDRLAPLMQVAAEAVAAGDVSAITPYLKVLDRLDRYQTAASAHQVYDDEARQKLLDKINRIASNLGVDEVMQAAAVEHLKKQGVIVDEAAEPEEQEAETQEAETAILDEEKKGGASAWDFSPSA